MDQPAALPALTERELEALCAASAWYAKYHASVVAEEADDGGARALEDRRRYLDLIAALGKLGVRLRVPDALLETSHAA